MSGGSGWVGGRREVGANECRAPALSVLPGPVPAHPSMNIGTRLILLINKAAVTRSLNLINCGYGALCPEPATGQTENCLINALFWAGARRIAGRF